MKKIILFMVFLGLVVNTFAYDKKSLVERFTNASCAPCASLNNSWYNATTAGMLNSESISQIIYNVWWPGANDPMYLFCLLYTSPSPRDRTRSRMPSSA